MSFDLTILGATPDATDDEIRDQALRCAAGRDHPEGDLDARIVAFYEVLRGVHPDSGPASRSEETPWASSPLDIGIDHVNTNLRHGCAGDVIDTIVELAALHGLVVFDPQDGTITRPHQPGGMDLLVVSGDSRTCAIPSGPRDRPTQRSLSASTFAQEPVLDRHGAGTRP
jgi:hypothetical protein